jgi:glycosyltransferase involved in cell wall biosynthesis
MNGRPQVVVAHLGARRHYAVPVILLKAGMLAHFYTDLYAGEGWPKLLNWIPTRLCLPAMRKLRARSANGDSVFSSKLTTFATLALGYYRRLKHARTSSHRTEAYFWAGDEFARRIVRCDDGKANVLYAVTSASSLLLEHFHGRGATTVLDQFEAPHEEFIELWKNELQFWDGWEGPIDDALVEQRTRRERQEWLLSDAIIAPSRYVANGLAERGVDPHKCHVVPCGLNVDAYASAHCTKGTGKSLNVLFVGRCELMKGIQYFLQAVKPLGALVSARVVGAATCNRNMLLSAAPANTVYIGEVPSSEILEHYRWADVLSFPSLSDGFGMACLQAMAAGVPVIASANAGASEVIRDGLDGYRVPARDSRSITEKLQLLVSDRGLVARMSCNARQRAREFDLHHYGQRLISAITAAFDRRRADV